jgi:chromosome segregation ATPase
MDALEHEVRLLTSRLAGWVEAQLVQALDDRRQEMKALRSELLFMVNEQVSAPAPADGEALEQRVRAAMSRLSDSVEARLSQDAENRRAELDAVRSGLEAAIESQVRKAEASAAATLAAVQDSAGASATLGVRLDEVAGQAAAAAQAAAAFRAEADALPERMEAFEQRVKAAMGRLTDSVETRLAETAPGRNPSLDELRAPLRAAVARTEALDQQVQALRSELEADRQSLRERLDALAAQVASVTDSMGAVQVEVDAGPARAELLEQRVRSAVGRLAESMESRLSDAETARAAEVTALRTELETAVTALRARSSQVQERLDSVEQLHRDAGERLGQMVEVTLAEVIDGRRVELEALRRELEATLAAQLREGRIEIGTAVADAHRRFVVSVDRLEEQMHLVTEQAAAAQAAVARVEVVPEAVASDGRRIEALEEHTRRTDARLGELVDAKLAELAAQPVVEVEGVRQELRTALDAHLAEIRAEVATSLVESRTEAAARATRFDERLADFDALEERIEQAVGARMVALDAAAAEVAAGRAEVAKAVVSLERKTARAREQVEQRVERLAEQVEALVKTAANEGGALAPLRSDLRLLQAQLAELAATVAELPPRRTAAPATRSVTAPARKSAAAPARKSAAAPAKKVASAKPAPRRRVQ